MRLGIERPRRGDSRHRARRDAVAETILQSDGRCALVARAHLRAALAVSRARVGRRCEPGTFAPIERFTTCSPRNHGRRAMPVVAFETQDVRPPRPARLQFGATTRELFPQHRPTRRATRGRLRDRSKELHAAARRDNDVVAEHTAGAGGGRRSAPKVSSTSSSTCSTRPNERYTRFHGAEHVSSTTRSSRTGRLRL